MNVSKLELAVLLGGISALLIGQAEKVPELSRNYHDKVVDKMEDVLIQGERDNYDPFELYNKLAEEFLKEE